MHRVPPQVTKALSKTSHTVKWPSHQESDGVGCGTKGKDNEKRRGASLASHKARKPGAGKLGNWVSYDVSVVSWSVYVEAPLLGLLPQVILQAFLPWDSSQSLTEPSLPWHLHFLRHVCHQLGPAERWEAARGNWIHVYNQDSLPVTLVILWS